MDAKKLTKIIKLATCLATVFLVIVISVIAFQFVKINSLKKDIDDITTKIEAQEEKLNTLKQDSKNHSTSVYIEDVARRELGHLGEGESYIEFK